jgi:hypothetical protein
VGICRFFEDILRRSGLRNPAILAQPNAKGGNDVGSALHQIILSAKGRL